MTDKEFRRLSRADLIEIIYVLQQNEKALREQNEELKQQLADRQLAISESGSLAEVLARLNGLFGAAQATAEDYMHEARRARADAQALLEQAQQARKQADDYYLEIQGKTATLAALSLKQRQEMLAKTEEECRLLRQAAQEPPAQEAESNDLSQKRRSAK